MPWSLIVLVIFFILIWFQIFIASQTHFLSVAMEGLPGGCNPADVLFKLAHARGIKAPVFQQVGTAFSFINMFVVMLQVSEQGPPHAKTFTCACSFLEVGCCCSDWCWSPASFSYQGQHQSEGQGRSKKEARNAAAKRLIEQLDLSTLPQVGSVN